MKKEIILLMIFIAMFSCNNSDEVQKLPLGYAVFYEGGNQNRLLKNNHLVIDSGLVDCKFNNNYLLVSVDTTYSMNYKNIDKKNLKYFIQDLKKDTIIKKIDYLNLKRIIKEKNYMI